MSSYLVSGNVEECCSCRACEAVCPKKCIELNRIKGHLYPYIDKSRCISCGLCEKVCQYNNRIQVKAPSFPKVYSAWMNKDNIIRTSSSGGLFTGIAEYGIQNGYRIYAAKYTSDMNVIIHPFDSMEEIEAFRGSKYVKSDVCDTYQMVKTDLEKGLKVIYFGSPCQIGGLKHFLKKEYDNLIVIDIICHGMPSPKLFQEYIKHLESEYQGKVKSFYFRHKVDGVTPYVKVEFENGKILCEPARDNMYMKLYNSMYSLMPSCTKCLYTTIYRSSDLTIGDFWNLEKKDKNRVNPWGTSIAICNNEKGKNLLEQLKNSNSIQLYEANIKEALDSNPQLSCSSKANPLNGIFIRALGKVSIRKLFYVFVVVGNRVMFPYRVLRKIKSLIIKR